MFTSYVAVGSEVAAVMFVAIYAFFPWWRDWPGRSAMNLGLAIALALSMSVWRALTATAPPNWYRTAIFVWIFIALWGQVAVLVTYQRIVRRRGAQALQRRRSTDKIGEPPR